MVDVISSGPHRVPVVRNKTTVGVGKITFEVLEQFMQTLSSGRNCITIIICIGTMGKCKVLFSFFFFFLTISCIFCDDLQI